MANDFVYAQPVKIRFGEGCLEQLGEVFAELNVERVVLVCGRHFAARAEALREKFPQIRAVFAEVQPDPQLSGAARTAELARETEAQAVVGIGGGSAMDTAKFAAAVALSGESAQAYFDGLRPFPAHE